ncbi:MAG TPA: tol-pal system protein YbgF [Acidobacteriota bacterium]|nr:tol-pal system protein YbgF [Acidobacteriota bacterium]
MNTRAVGACLLLIMPLWSAGTDKTKKATELIYDDVQLLKKQVLDIADRLEKNAEEIRLVRQQLDGLGESIQRSQADQTGLKEDMKAVPQQYQALAGRIEQLSLDLARISDALIALRGGAPPAAAAEARPADAKAPGGAPSAAKPADQAGTPPPPVPSNVSPQDVYNMAYNDYLKGNFDLAVEGFKMYQEQFPASPLADNALYWIGECAYSQRKFEDAVNTFNELILAYPQGDKVAVAYLKKGMSFAEMGRTEEALAAFKLLVAKFPVEEETRIAQQKIKELGEK